ncbi:hypothetical protein PUMCH_002330 [Australozyma saopauloensis]|uniref:Indoleamine 2,3-dioxygenase n=1 Tax=Australozyma saopauloensis TaxID=291208 RepID=A0AAX4H8Y7_9ASCO|nr:hypothetical protein PUMCH_002330 [[Candida] saopauloensis]
MLDVLSFDVDPQTGFLPAQYPITRIADEYYQPWERLVENLPAVLLTKKIRTYVDKLPVLSTDRLGSKENFRRAYQVLGYLAHAYVWGTDQPVSQLPELIARPLVETADELGLPPLGTYASFCLWNFKEIIPSGGSTAEMDFDNITTINTFTGSIDESWFYLVSVFFELAGAKTVKFGLDSMEHAQNGDFPELIKSLQSLAQSVDHLGSILLKMEEMCDPYVFYFRIRPYLAGWLNMTEVGLDKDGVLYGTESKRRSYAGGLNAQSSLISFLDALLSVHHFSTGKRPVPHQADSNVDNFEDFKQLSPKNEYLIQMRQYMPREHRDFLLMVDESSTIREVVMANKANSELTLSYDACLAMLKLFRDKHIQLVTRYVVLQAKRAPSMGSLQTLRSGLAKQKQEGAKERGTGGTSLLPFLKQCRDETGDPAAGNWGKRLLSDGVMRLNYSKSNGINED